MPVCLFSRQRNEERNQIRSMKFRYLSSLSLLLLLGIQCKHNRNCNFSSPQQYSPTCLYIYAFLASRERVSFNQYIFFYFPSFLFLLFIPHLFRSFPSFRYIDLSQRDLPHSLYCLTGTLEVDKQNRESFKCIT